MLWLYAMDECIRIFHYDITFKLSISDTLIEAIDFLLVTYIFDHI